MALTDTQMTSLNNYIQSTANVYNRDKTELQPKKLNTCCKINRLRKAIIINQMIHAQLHHT